MEEKQGTTLTDKQKDKLDQFKKKVADVVKEEYADHDGYLLRWLKARNYDLSKSENMLREHMKWRVEWDVDNIMENYKPAKVLVDHFPLPTLFGETKEGHAVFGKSSRDMDTKGMVMSAKLKDVMKYFIYGMENVEKTIREKNKKNGSSWEGAVFVEDCEGITLGMFFTPGMSDLMKMGGDIIEKNYPEIQKYLFIVKAPRIFPAIYAIVKPFMPEETKRKMQILGKNYAEVLQKYMDKEKIPTSLGGDLVDPEGFDDCRSIIPKGYPVPEEFYLTGAKLVKDESKIVTIKVARAGKVDLEYEMNNNQQVLKWIFWTDAHDIKFGVSRKGSDTELTEVITPERIPCSRVPEDGVLKCEQSGTYIVHFDNTYSWVNGKTVHYVIEVETIPDEE